MTTTPLFSSYWCGYADASQTNPLNTIPDCAEVVALAFAGLNPDSTMTTSFLCKTFGLELTRQWAQEARNKGQKVYMSIIDSDTVHWNQIDLDKYVQSAVQTVLGDWKLDGFNIDGEGPAIDVLAQFVPKLRGAIGSTVPITYTCYYQTQDEADIIAKINGCIDELQTMTYWNNYEGMIAEAEYYANLVGSKRVSIGISDRITDFDECGQLAQWVKNNPYSGMMLWSEDCDNTSITGRPLWAYTNQVAAGLKGYRLSHEYEAFDSTKFVPIKISKEDIRSRKYIHQLIMKQSL